MNEEEKRKRKRASDAKYCRTEKAKARRAKYRRTEKGKAVNAKYHRTKKGKAANVKYHKTEKGKEASRKGVSKFFKSEKGKLLKRKVEAKRRSLGFIELNDPFQNSEGHHITKEFVIYMPKEMHRSVTHNVFTGKNMEQINDMAVDYCYGD